MEFSTLQIIGLVVIAPYSLFIILGMLGHIGLIKKPYLLFGCIVFAIVIFHFFDLKPVLEYYWYRN